MANTHQRPSASPLILWILFFGGIALLLWTLHVYGWMRAWTFFCIPAVYPPFIDLRTVQGALNSIAKGFDPRLINPGDPLSRPMNYPMIWITIARVFRFDNEIRYMLFVSSYVIAFLVCAWDLLRKAPSFWMLAAIFSGSTMLAIERGNNDLLIFVLLYVGSIVSIFSVSAALILLCTALKIYPVFAAVSLLRKKLVFGGLLLAAALLFLINIDDILKVKSNTPITAALSYGVPSIVAGFHKVAINISPILLDVMLLIMIGALVVSKNFKDYCAVEEAPKEIVRLFMVGSGIYVGTFVLSGNYDYRLIFILLCIPYLLYMKNKYLKNLLLAQILLASNYFILFRLLGKQLTWLISSLSKTALFVILCAFLIREMLNLLPELQKYQAAEKR